MKYECCVFFLNLHLCTLTYLFQLVTYGTDRTAALSTMAKALDSYVIRGERSRITVTYNTLLTFIFLKYISPNTSIWHHSFFGICISWCRCKLDVCMRILIMYRNLTVRCNDLLLCL